MQNIKLWFQKLKNTDDTTRETWIIRVLILIFVIIGAVFLITREKDIFSNNNTQNISFDSTIHPISWQINLPKNYNIKDSGSYDNEYYSVFYENWSGNYRVRVYQGGEYDFRDIRFFIDQQLLNFKDFEDYTYFETHKVIYEDKRHNNIPTMDIPDKPYD